jgi:hypothetical protein
MVILIYCLCALTSFVCAWALLRSYFGNRSRILLWTGLSFCFMFLNNVFLILDRIVFPDVDLTPVRLGLALTAVTLLVVGLVWEDE